MNVRQRSLHYLTQNTVSLYSVAPLNSRTFKVLYIYRIIISLLYDVMHMHDVFA